MDDTRGLNLQSFYAASVQIAIFRQHSIFWRKVFKECIDACYSATSEFLRSAAVYVAGHLTDGKLIHAFIEQSCVEIEGKLDSKLEELLWPYRRSHLSTQNPRWFIDNIITLTIEAVLLDKITGSLTFEDVARLQGVRLAEIAAEPPGARQRRVELNSQIAAWTCVIRTCKKFQQASPCTYTRRITSIVSLLTVESIRR